jgi:hypothetical protein
MAKAARSRGARHPRTDLWQDKTPTRGERVTRYLRRVPQRYSEEPELRLVLAVLLAVCILIVATIKWG